MGMRVGVGASMDGWLGAFYRKLLRKYALFLRRRGYKSKRRSRRINEALGLFHFAGAGHKRVDGLVRRPALVQDGVHLFGDGHLDFMLLRQANGGVSGVHTLGNHAMHARDDLWQLAAFAQLDP